MDRVDISKVLFYATSIISFFTLSFGFGLYSASNKTVVYEAFRSLKNSFESSLDLIIKEKSTLTKSHPTHFLQPCRYDGTGVTVNDFKDSTDDLVLLAGFFDNNNELRLIHRNGSVISRWPVRFSEIYPDSSHIRKPPATDWNVDIHGSLALPDGSVVFNFEYAGLVKLDRCGNVVWTLKRMSHHSVELAEDGGFWVPGWRFHPKESASPFPPFQTPYYENTIMKISDNGKILQEISVPKLFYDNGLESLLTSTGINFMSGKTHGWEIVHLNKISELSSENANDFPLFDSGDLLLSLREHNLLVVVDIDNKKIKWWRIGPWIRQHDPEFIPGGKIIVFNNNIYRTALGGPSFETCSVSVPRISNIIEIDPFSDQCRVIYGSIKGQEMLSIIRGKHELTTNSGLLITEFEGGRVFETDVSGRVIWEYVNRYDSDHVAEITEARVYSSDYFHLSDWSCE